MTIRDAIESMMIKNHNGIGYTLVGDDDMPNLSGLTMESGTLGFNYSDVEEEKERLQAEYDAQAYARSRASSYDSIGNQLDMIYKDNLNGTTTHKDAVEAVKTKWPKNNKGPIE